MESCRGKNSQNENNDTVSVPQLQDSGQVVIIPTDAESMDLAVLDQQNSQNADTYAHPYMELSLRQLREHEYQSLGTRSDPVVPHDPEGLYEVPYVSVIT